MVGVLVIAALAAALMGFAIQRGATCTVAAIGDVVLRRRWDRLVALGEASLWVAVGLLSARAAGIVMALPAAFTPTLATVAGGVLLGLGAVLNGACVFGAIARLGSGEWAFAATPIGFLLGCVAFERIMPAPAVRDAGSAIAGGPWWLAGIVVALAGWRGLRFATQRPQPSLQAWRARAAHHWTPHAATLVIGVCFVVMLLAVGPWAYTDALAELARGITDHGAMRLLLFAALLAGAVAGGWSAGLLGHRRVTWLALARCFAGGALMAAGSLLIPGSNDGLILIGLPLLQPYAWLAFATMAATVAVTLSPSIRGHRSAAR